jgi:hypothetical protein
VIAAALGCAAVLLAAAPQSPVVARMGPFGGQRGTEVTVQFVGQRLGDPLCVLQSRPGLEVVGMASPKPEECSVTLRIAEDCPLGAHPLRLCTASGVANLVLFHVGSLPEVVVPREPAGGVAALPFGATATGMLQNEQIDRLACEIAAGTRVRCEVVALRLGRTNVDLVLDVFDPDGERIARVDDTTLGLKDPIVAFVATKSGAHVLQLSTAFPLEGNVGAYRLSIGGFPRPTGWLPCGGAPGERLAVTLLGPGGEPEPVHVVLPEDPGDGGDLFRFHPQNAHGASPTPILFRVGGPPNREATRDEQGRLWLELPGSVHGVLAEPGETMRFHVRGKKGEEVEFRCVARSLRSPLDPVLVARDERGRRLAVNDDGAGFDSVLRVTWPADGEYSVEVADLLRAGGDDHFFRLEAGPRSDAESARLVVARREDPVVCVPQGNRAGGVLQLGPRASRAAPAIAASGLPPGVVATFARPARGSNLVPFVLEAAADAGLGGALVGFEQVTGDVAQRLDFEQYVPLVSARNDQPVLGAAVRELPVAVARPAPFAVVVEPPAAPIVKGGPLAMGVRVERADGFTEPVRLRALWSPPGLAAGQATAAAGEAFVPWTAAESAAPGVVPVAIVGQARVGGAVLEVCSALVEIGVEEPWLRAEVAAARAPRGGATDVRVALTPARTLPGPGVARLLSLPRGVTCEPVAFAADATSLVLRLGIAADAPLGRHRGLVLALDVAVSAEAGAAVVQHRFAAGVLRIDEAVAGDGGKP